MKNIFLLTMFLNILLATILTVPNNHRVFAVCTGDGTIFDSSAGCYQQLAPITDPAGGEVNTDSFPKYLQGMYRIGIGACFVLGVIMFTWAGIEYIISEAMGTKKDAQNRMTNALIGVAIALVSWILLNTINPDLLKFNNLKTSVTQTTK